MGDATDLASAVLQEFHDPVAPPVGLWCRFIESTDSTKVQKHTPNWKPAVPPASWSSSRRTTAGQPVSIRSGLAHDASFTGNRNLC